MAQDKKKGRRRKPVAARPDRGGEAGEHAGPRPRQPGQPRRGGAAAVPRRSSPATTRRRSRTGSGRLELAQAIASKDNPLTARVIVNRVWMHHFGRGLVGTPSNFGTLGERPTHPELLDYLAARFVADGWSLKKLHREIMLSADVPAEQPARRARTRTVDPDNQLPVADEPPPAGGRGVARRDAGRRRQARPARSAGRRPTCRPPTTAGGRCTARSAGTTSTRCCGCSTSPTRT